MTILAEIKTDKVHCFKDENGDRHGEYKDWYSNGQMWEHCFFEHGWRNGEYKSWHHNGNLHRHTFYINGKRHGEYKRWCENGQLIEHYICVNGYETDIPIPTCEEDEFAICLEYGHMQFLR